MSGPPPGYNPSDSLLTGGTTQISGVMGGGGASDSMLSGGNSAIIQGVQGGGKVRRAISARRKRKLRSVQKGGDFGDIVSALGNTDQLNVLLEDKDNKADINGITAEGKTLIEMALSIDTPSIDILQILIKAGANVNIKMAGADVYGKTPLIYAIEKKVSTDIIQLLLKAGADLDSKVGSIYTPLSLACESKQKEIAQLLFNSGADLDAVNGDGTTTLNRCQAVSDELGLDANLKKRLHAGLTDISSKIDTYLSTEKLSMQLEQYISIRDIKDTYGPYVTRKVVAWDSNYITKDNVPSTSTPKELAPYSLPTRAFTVLPQTQKNLIIVPAINGDVSIFQQHLMSMENLTLFKRSLGNVMTLQPDTTLVFMPPFYKSYIGQQVESTRANNMRLLAAFLTLESNNQGNVIVLAEHTNDNVIGGIYLNPPINLTTFPKPPIPNLLESSYVLYPYSRKEKKGILLSAKSSLAESSFPAYEYNNKLRVNDLFNRPNSEAFSGVITPLTDPNEIQKITIGPQGFDLDSLIRYQSSIESTRKVMPAVNPICKSLVETKEIESVTTEDLSRWITGTSDEIIPYFILIQLMNDKPYCTKQRDEPNRTGNIFTVDDESEIHKDSADFVNVDLEFPDKVRNYQLRNPSDYKTEQHWRNLQFTKDEAAFLNDLNFSPNILNGAFGGGWIKELVDWMKLFAEHRCFGPENLLLDSDCRNMNEFMKTMYNFFESVEGAKMVAELATVRQKEADDAAKRDAESDPVTHPVAPETALPEAFSREFTSQKITWNTVNPIQVVEGTADGDKPAFSLGVLMVKHLDGHPEQYRFGSVKVTADSEDDARELIITKIADLRRTYPKWSFIY